MDDRAQLDALLTALVAAGRPSSMSLPRRDGLRNFTELAQWLAGPGQGQPGEDLEIAGPAGRLALRVYRPSPPAEETAAGTAPPAQPPSSDPAPPGRASQADPALPAAMFFHGGGWVLGGLDSHSTLCRELAHQAGVVLIAVDYRLAPEHPFPAALDDCVAATRWVAAHAADLGVDSSRLAVAGDSSGASLAAGVALRARDAGDVALALQALAYPALDPAMSSASYSANADDPFLSRGEMEFYWSAYLGGGTADDRAFPGPAVSGPAVPGPAAPGLAAPGLAAPGLAPDLARLPPAYVLVAGRDVLHDEGVAYADRLRAAGVPVRLRSQPEMVHGFLLCTGWLDAARDSVAELAAFLRTGLGPADGP